MKKILSAVLMIASLNSLAADNCHLGEVMTFAGNFVPRGFLEANGQLLSISQHTALFSILGTTYGGDGRTTFALPNLNNRSVVNGNNVGLLQYNGNVVDLKEPVTGIMTMKQVICIDGIYPSRQ